MDAKIKMTKAVSGLVLDQPFFASMVMKMKLVTDQSCETIWTDGLTIGYNPEFVKDLSINKIKGVLAHDVMHVVLDHHLRIQSRDTQTWNKACDYPVNKIIKESGFELPDRALLNQTYGDMSADSIYEEIYIKLDQQSPGPDPNGPNNGGQQNQPNAQPGHGNNNDPGGCGEVRMPPVTSPLDIAKLQADNRINIIQSYNIAKSAGRLPAGLKRYIDEEILSQKVDWKEYLRDFVDIAAKGDYSWSSPNTRYLGSGFYLPSINSKEIGNIVVAIDTSGSIYDEILLDFAGEMKSITDTYPNIRIKTIYCDSMVYDDAVEEFGHGDDIILNPVGGGGTDFVPVFEYIENQDDTPVCLVYLTDMMCHSFPNTPPDYPVLWVQWGDYEKEPPFGGHVKIEFDRSESP